MTAPEVRAVELLVNEAWAAFGEDRYQAAAAAARRAVRGAELLDEPSLLVRALDADGYALRLAGDYVAALANYTRILALVEDPASGEHLRGEAAAMTVAGAHLYWTEAARYVPGIDVRQLFTVLDAGDKWLIATGHRSWRAGILLQRAAVHRDLDEVDAAVAVAQEALAAYQPGAPGFTIATHRCDLAILLLETDRVADADTLLRAVVDDPATGEYDRLTALRGLSRAARATGDTDAARRHATAALQLADLLGGPTRCYALNTLTAAHRASGDLDAARLAADQELDLARDYSSPYILYDALCDVVDVALDQADLDTATTLLPELAAQAAMLDQNIGNTTYADKVAARRTRLGELG